MAEHEWNRRHPSRRAFFITGVGAFAALKAMPATPGCTLNAEQEVGPYYLDYLTLRQNITEDKQGLPLRLRVALVDTRSCRPLTGAALDIWHCDALGVYSGFTAANADGRGFGRRGMPPPPDGFDPDFAPGDGRGMPPPPFGRGGPDGPGGPPPARSTDTSRFLRGVQLTDAQGIAEFTTVYPGWYAGRCIHIHMKVHVGGATASGKYAAGHVSHTGQFFFPEEITDEVSRMDPYAKRLEVHRTLQSEDGVFTHQHGASSMATLERLTPRTNADGFLARATLAVDPEATPAPVGVGGRRGGRPG